MKLSFAASALLLSRLAAFAAEPQVIYLWPNGAPGSENKTGEEKVQVQPAGDHVISNVHRPSVTVYLPPKEIATGVAIVIAPGGGHSTLWVDHEGYNPAKFFQEHGIAGVVLKYRLAREPGSTYTVEGTALEDTQRAIRLVKSRAEEWGIDPARIGVIGFSAGGELAALAATHVSEGKPDARDQIDRLSSKVGFFGLMYPAIPKDMPLSKDMPPAFLVCGENDRQNISQGLPELYIAMKKAGAQAELHVYTKVGHGFGVRATTKGPVAQWPQRFYEWMDSRGLLKPAENHVVPIAEIRRDTNAAALERARDLADVGHALELPAVKDRLGKAHVSGEFVKAAVSQLDDAELARLAARARAADQDVVAGGKGTILFIAGLALVIALIVVLTQTL